MYTGGKNNALSDPKIAGRVEFCIINLKKVFDLKKVILFGSIARDTSSKNTTMDFLIIANTELPFFERIKEALKACSDGEPSVEPLVYTPQEIEELVNIGEGFIEEALEEGQVVFDASHQ